jgi:hypothetical protein
MPEVFTQPGDMRDGCGPYGRHLVGAVDWQKLYAFSDNHGGVTPLLLGANTDYLIPIPPPSETLPFSNCSFLVSNIGTTATLRAAILSAENYPTLTRILDLGEVSVALPGIISLSGSYVLPRNSRSFVAVCGAGVVLCQLSSENADRKPRSWLGALAADFTNIGHLIYSRAYGAFPATYDGVFNSTGTVRILSVGAI